MPSWEPDPTLPAERLPLFGEVHTEALRRSARWLASVVVLALGATALIVAGRTNTAEAVLLGYVTGGLLFARARVFVGWQRDKQLLAKPFERVDLAPGHVTVAGREIGVRLPDGRWLRRSLPWKQHGIVTAPPRLWVLRHGDRAAFLLPGAGLFRARIDDLPPDNGAPPPAPTADAWPAVRRARYLRSIGTAAVALAVATALLAWARLSFAPDDRSFLATGLGAAAVCSGFLVLVACLRLLRRAPPVKWSELEVEPDPRITLARGRLRVEGHTVRSDGTRAKFVVPKAGLIVTLEFAAGGRLWTTGKAVRGRLWTSRIRFQPVGPLPDHDHA